MGDFISDFNAGLDDAETAFAGGCFTVKGKSWPAISVDKLQMEQRATLGGRYQNVTTTIIVRPLVALAAGLRDGVELSVEEEYFRVTAIEKDGDDAWTILCGPAGFDLSFR